MTIRKEAEPGGTLPGGGQIVVGMDGSSGSLVALSWTLSEASLRGVGVHAVGVRECPGGIGGLGPPYHPSNLLFLGKPFGGKRPASARLPI